MSPPNEMLARAICLVLLLQGFYAVEGAAVAQVAQDAGATGRPSEPAHDAAAEQSPNEKLRFFRDRLQETRIVFPDQPERPLKLVPEPLSRFDNPVSGIADGFTFLWTDQGRPAVLLKSYYNAPRQSWGRTYVSLAERPLEMLSKDGGKVWTPPGAGLSFASLDEAPAPAATPRARLQQMREIARQFEVVDNWGIKDPTDWQLRLLTTPLYRYEVPDEKVIDGALFAYVLTTSPESLLLVEAREADSGLEWSFAVSRSTRFAITFSRDGKTVAEFPRIDSWPPTGDYFHLPLPMPDYPFKAVSEDR